MRVSSYTIGSRLPDEPSFVLLHGYTGAVDKVSATVGRYLLERRGEDCEPSELPETLVPRLLQRGYLTELGVEEERAALLRIVCALRDQELRSHHTVFIVVPTYLCNLRCPYCFQSHDMHAGAGAYANVMSLERADQMFRVIDDFLRPGAFARALGLAEAEEEEEAPTRGVGVTLFGGEPLLEATRPIVDHIVRQSGRRELSVGAITNGVELHHFADLIGPERISSLQITLDGPPEMHDRRRIGPEHRQTFDCITRNIDMALARDAQVGVRINVDGANTEAIEWLNQDFAARGWTRHPRFFAQAATVHEGMRNHAPRNLISGSELVQITSTLKRKQHGIIESYESPAADVLRRCLSGSGYPFRRVSFCGAERGMMVFDPLGDIYACWEELGMPDERIGTYGSEGLNLFSEAATKWLTRFPGSIEECSACPYALIHTSGCAREARRSSGTIFAPACQSFQEYFPTTLAREYMKWEDALLNGTGSAPLNRDGCHMVP